VILGGNTGESQVSSTRGTGNPGRR